MASRRNGRALAVATATAPVRAAIYTRKSTTAGLDGNFTSLHNQRERAEAYVDSQRDQGWMVVPTAYDDGGFSGGNVDRPALQQLLSDVERGLLDAIVVYRLDRISRSLADFVNIHRFLDKHGVALVSVTESINTKSPHGRMMVNVLLSFAQYERELIGERTRDKVRAARRRGKYTGGTPPFGYRVENACLVVNDVDAPFVRMIFERYLEVGSLIRLANELNRRGIGRGDKSVSFKAWTRVNLQRLLTNHVYVGMVKLDDDLYRGEHRAIVPKALFEKVQKLMAANRSNGGATARNQHGALLRSLLHCVACGTAMVHAPTKAHGRLYRYYRCTNGMRQGADACPTRAIAADRVEAFVVDQIRCIGASPELQGETFRQAVAQVKAQRRGLKLETARLKTDLATARADVQRLVETVSRVTGPAAEAVTGELNVGQERATTIETRHDEIATELAGLDAQNIDPADLARALAEFDPVWDVLLTPERERVLRLLIDHVDYDGRTQQLTIHWRLAGFGQLAAEVAP